jgi:hypothetical protein
MLYNVLFLHTTICTSSSVVQRWATGWMFGGFESRQGMGIFFFSTASRPALEPTQPPIQWVPGALSLWVKRPGCETDHSPPSSAEVKNAWRHTSTPQYAFMAWCSVKKSTGTLPLAILSACTHIPAQEPMYIITWMKGNYSIISYFLVYVPPHSITPSCN